MTAPARAWALHEVAPIGLAKIVTAIEHAFGLAKSELTDYGRDNPNVILARKLACYLCRDMTGASYPAIGRIVCRDHTTVMAHCEDIREQFAVDAQLRRIVGKLKEHIRGGR